jgi:hypothetical protein
VSEQNDFGVEVPPGYDFASYGLSHEIAEWSADPFLSNIVPSWSLAPGLNDFTCSNILEVADPAEMYPIGLFLPSGVTSVLADTVTLSYFARQVPSTALGGLYDLTGLISAPSTPCS